ncbi:jg1124 [Pararge aegeria aegeria]|uniref:Jg1124 protein n=1 Tax=Pararge aegeria aegeria TaxID=348720 RepID=A0A8S4R7H6_9NEOP|nr:jg1124 [Pararge aegeria aegeria]
MGGHIARRTVGRCVPRRGNPAPVNAALVDPKPDGQTTSNKSREPLDTSAPDSWSLERHKRQHFESNGRQSVDLMTCL